MHHSPTHRGRAALTSPEYAGFSHRRDQFEALVDHALAHAKKLGATDAGAEASEACGLSVSVRKGELETVERNRERHDQAHGFAGIGLRLRPGQCKQT